MWSPRPSALTANLSFALLSRICLDRCRLLICASASISTTSPRCATRAAAAILIRSAPRIVAIEAGADGITAHLREDRRHIRDEDMARLKAEISKPLNFEMAATDEMLGIALKTAAACRVPRAGAPSGGDHRRRARRRRPARCPRAGDRPAQAMPASASRCSSPPIRARSRWPRRLKAPVIEIHVGRVVRCCR